MTEEEINMLEKNPLLLGFILGLEKGLKKTETSSYLRLKNCELNGFTTQELQLIFKCIPENKNHLDLSDNKLYMKTDEELETLLNGLPKHINRVTLINNGLQNRLQNLKLNEGLTIIIKVPSLATIRSSLYSPLNESKKLAPVPITDNNNYHCCTIL